jgi:hypothetical protein
MNTEFLNRTRLRRRCYDCQQVFPVWSKYDDEIEEKYLNDNRQQMPGAYELHKVCISWQADPFLSDVRGDNTPRWLCYQCACISAGDI